MKPTTRIQKLATAVITLLATAGNLLIPTAQAQGTAFTYQGRLDDSNGPVTGLYDFEFRLYNAPGAGDQQGAAIASDDVGVTNGLFTVTLDFGAQFPGADRWLQIDVRTNGTSVFTALAPRQKLSATPYAITAGTVSGAVPASQLTGTIAAGRLPASVVTNGASGLSLTGTFSGNGAGITNVNVDQLQQEIGFVIAWGANDYGQTTVPSSLNDVVAIAGGGAHSLALKSDGTVTAWGNNNRGQTNVPAGLSNVVAIAGGYDHSLALKSDGTAAAWGFNQFGQASIPVGLSNVVDVAAGYGHSLALKSDGKVVVWGANYEGQTNVPVGLTNVVAIDAGFEYNVALKRDGTVVAWGATNYASLMNFPVGLSNVVAIAAGYYDSLALKSDGTVVAWGVNSLGAANVPAGLSNVVAIAAGGSHGLALKRDGTIVAWGGNGHGQTSIPTGLSNVVAIAGGDRQSLALRRERIPAQLALLTGNNTFQGAVTAARFSGAFTGDGSGLTNVNASILSLDASKITTGTLDVARLPANVALLDGAQTFTGAKTFNNPGNAFAGDGGGLRNLSAGQLSGTLPTAVLPGSAVTNGASGLTLSGTFIGNGASISNLDASHLTMGIVPPAALGNAWKTGGNAGTSAGAHFLGTTDNQALEMKVNGERALRLEPNAVSPNILGGYAGNIISNGVVGGFIGGGGSVNVPNRVEGNFAAVLGGANSVASGDYSTAIGWRTTASGDYSTAIGPQSTASGDQSMAMGFRATASGWYSTAMGADTTASGILSMAMGFNSKATNQGTFVWSDNSSGLPFTSTADNQFLIRAVGGVGIGTGAPATKLHVSDAESRLRLQSTAANAYAVTEYQTDARTWHSGVGGSTTGPLADKYYLYDANAGQTRLVVDQTGNVGVGTTSPAAKLHVAGNLTVEGTDAVVTANRVKLGWNNTASGSSATALGLNTTANGDSVTAMGEGTSATGYAATAIGSETTASGTASTAMGRRTTAAGGLSTAMGHRARANHPGSLVWADAQDADFASTAANQFSVRAQNGVVIQAAANSTALELRSGGAIKVTGAGIGTATPVFIHRATAANIQAGAAHRTTIDHPMCNGDPNAILIVTQNYNAQNIGNVSANHSVGVYFNPDLNKWQIFHQNIQPIDVNTAWNVLVVKP